MSNTKPQMSRKGSFTFNLPFTATKKREFAINDTLKKKSFLGKVPSMFNRKPTTMDVEELGPPQVVEHVEHIEFDNVKLDASSPCGFAGLPKRWEMLLLQSGITREDVLRHSAAAIDVLNSHMNDITASPALPTRQQVDNEFTKAVEVIREDPTELFTKIRKAGETSAGEIWQCSLNNNQKKGKKKKKSSFTSFDIQDYGTMFACKICDVVSPLQVYQEIALLSICRGHPNIVNYIGTYSMEKTLWIINEWMPSSIDEILYIPNYKDGRPNLEPSPWEDGYISYVLHEVLQALEFLHKNYRIHRNMKAANILWNGTGQIKVADFGDAVTLSVEESRRRSKVGSSYWMAPEILRSEDYGFGVDIWSLGITTFELAIGEPPFKEEAAPMRAMFLILIEPAPKLPKELNGRPSPYSDLCVHFTSVAANKDPVQRATASELLMHPFMDSRCSKEEFGEFALALKAKNRDL